MDRHFMDATVQGPIPPSTVNASLGRHSIDSTASEAPSTEEPGPSKRAPTHRVYRPTMSLDPNNRTTTAAPSITYNLHEDAQNGTTAQRCSPQAPPGLAGLESELDVLPAAEQEAVAPEIQPNKRQRQDHDPHPLPATPEPEPEDVIDLCSSDGD